jgi:hypothetical protein
MYKIANQVLDAIDNGLEIRGAVRTPEMLSKLRDEDYALSVTTKLANKINKFPIFSADETKLSQHFFLRNLNKLPGDAQKIAAYHIKEACLRFGVATSPVLMKIAGDKDLDSNHYLESGKFERSVTRSHVDLTKIAEVQKIAENETHAQYAFASPDLVKLAIDYFRKNGEAMPPKYRAGYALALQKRASELGMGTIKDVAITKYASDHYAPMIDGHIIQRMQMLDGRQDDKKITLQKVAAARESVKPADFAKLLSAFDKTAGLNRYYGSHLTDPYALTFGADPSQFDGLTFSIKTAKKDGSAYSRNLTAAQIDQIVDKHHAKIAEYLGPHVADELKKFPQIFGSLPNDAKAIIAGIHDGTH